MSALFALAWLVSASAASAAAPAAPALGVIIAPRGQVLLFAGGEDSRPAAVGERLVGGQQIETGLTGWVELRLADDACLRLSAGSRIGFEEEDGARRVVRLLVGRAWVQLPGPLPTATAAVERLAVVAGGHRVGLGAGGSAIIELTPSGGLALASRRGRVTVGEGEVPVGSVANSRLAPEAEVIAPRRPVTIKTGGDAIADLVGVEARTALGDRLGLFLFLLQWTQRVELGALDTRGISEILRLGPEISGSASLHDAVLEQALRPTPFFATEVPPKGPNVRVEVDYGN